LRKLKHSQNWRRAKKHAWPGDDSIREIKVGTTSFASVEIIYESRNSNGDANRLAKNSIMNL
jgi:hypothetical protein